MKTLKNHTIITVILSSLLNSLIWIWAYEAQYWYIFVILCVFGVILGLYLGRRCNRIYQSLSHPNMTFNNLMELNSFIEKYYYNIPSGLIVEVIDSGYYIFDGFKFEKYYGN